MDDLIAKMRGEADIYASYDVITRNLLAKAADALEAVHAENARLTAALHTQAEEAAKAAREYADNMERMRGALMRIACFDDTGANDWLQKHGSYGAFDEPHSVQIARAALQETPDA